VFGSNLNLWGWIAVLGAGFMTGGFISDLFWGRRNKRWVKEVLFPEAQRSGINIGSLLAVLEDSAPSRQGEEGLNRLRELAPAIRAEVK
jgi:hypothetical protein